MKPVFSPKHIEDELVFLRINEGKLISDEEIEGKRLVFFLKTQIFPSQMNTN